LPGRAVLRPYADYCSVPASKQATDQLMCPGSPGVVQHSEE